MRPASLDLSVTQGDDETFSFTFLDGTGAPFDLTGWTFSFLLLESPRSGADVVLESALTEGSVPFERVLVLTNEQTLALPRRTYWYLIANRIADDTTQTWLAGRVQARLTPDDDATPDDSSFDVHITNGEIRVIAAGNIGPAGPPGSEGPAGPDGPQGAPGPTGPGAYESAVSGGFSGDEAAWVASLEGAQGVAGSQGIQGIAGSTGPGGSQGIQGVAGPTGSQGSQGNQGPQGEEGPPGTDGLDGVTGPEGPEGDVGPDGPTGPQGIQGIQGEQGAATTILGELADEGDLPGTGDPGDAYLIDGDLWVWTGTVWENVGALQGPAGPTGATGATGSQGTQGPQGTTGATGATGSQGTQGIQGIQGIQGAIGDEGPEGPAGEQGEQGIQGNQGSEGVPGSTWKGAWSGATAYVTNDVVSSGGSTYIAVAPTTNDAPASSPAKWALHTAKGDTGTTGNTGPEGAVGGTGSAGADGRTVLNGAGAPAGGTGANGDYYIDNTADAIYGPKTAGAWGSATALVGPQGPVGDDGPDGADGRTILNGSGVPDPGLGVDGDFYIDTAADAYYGPKASGAWGSLTSLIGPQGTAGSAGSAGPGVPAGGATSTVLRKVDADDYDTEWALLTDASIATANKDGADGTVSMRSLGTGAAQASKGNHAHTPTFGTPTAAVDIGDSHGAGTGTDVARATHEHAVPAPSANYPEDVDDTEADGSATTPARSDHRHKYATGSIDDTHVKAANKDGASGTASMRTLGTGAAQAAAGDDARLSDSRTPTAHVVNSATHTASGLTAGHVFRASGATAFDFAALQDGDIPSTIARDTEVATARDRTPWKRAVRVATVADASLAISFDNGSSIDNVTLVTGDRILVKDQTTASENGVYVVAASGAPTADGTEFDETGAIVGATVFVREGSANRGSVWANAQTDPSGLPYSFARLDNSGLWKQAVRAASTVNVSTATDLEHGDVLDGYTLIGGDRVLLKNQSTASQNGIWVVPMSGAASRPSDADQRGDLATGTTVFVTDGTVNEETYWTVTTTGDIVPGSSNHTWENLLGAGVTYGASGYPVDVAASEADGVATTVARSDHAHKYGATSITDAHVAAANKDGAIDVPSMHTLGSGSLQAAPGNRQFTALDRYVINQATDSSGVVLATPTAQGTPDMTVAIAAGTAVLGGSASVAIGAGNVTIGAAHASLPRIDLITVQALNGTKTVTAGTAAFAPVAPGVPGFHVAIATVNLPANATAVTTAMIQDMRLAVRPLPEFIGPITVIDETTTITTGTAKVTFRMPFAMTVNAGHGGVKASLAVASTSGIPTIDINDGGTTILSTKLTIDANEKTSATAAAAPVVSDTALAADTEITIDIDVAGTGAKGLKVFILGTR